MSSRKPDHDYEIELFSQYLVGCPAAPRVRELYSSAMQTGPARPSAADAALLQYVMKHPSQLGLIDAGLALVRQESEVRRRLYVAFSILEASPEYADVFLAKRRSGWYVLVVGLIGVRAICRAVAGVFLVKVVAK